MLPHESQKCLEQPERIDAAGDLDKDAREGTGRSRLAASACRVVDFALLLVAVADVMCCVGRWEDSGGRRRQLQVGGEGWTG